MSTKKKNDNYMTVDEILEKRREQRLRGFATDNGNNYQTADEIIEAGYKQGIWKRPEPMEQPSTQNMSGRQNLIGKDDVTRYGTDFRLWKQNQRTKNETLPNITQNVISDSAKEYKENPLGYNYISRYDNNTSYSDVSGDIDKLEGLKGGAARRGKNTAAYDKAIEMLKEYAGQRYSLDGTDLSTEAIQDRQKHYTDNKREINRLNEQLSLDDINSIDKAIDMVNLSFGDMSTGKNSPVVTTQEQKTITDYLSKKYGVDFTKDNNEVLRTLQSVRNTVEDEQKSKNDVMRSRLSALENTNRVYERSHPEDFIESYNQIKNDPDFSPVSFSDIVNSDSKDKLTVYTKSHYDDYSGYNPNEISNIVSEGDVNNWGYISKSEKDIYYNLLNKEGEEKAYEYLNSLAPILKKRETEAGQERYQRTADAMPLRLGSFALAPVAIAGGISSFVDDGIKLLKGEEIDPNNYAHHYTNMTDAVMQSDVDAIEDATGGANLFGFSLGDAYQGVYSGYKSMLLTVLTNPTIASLVLSTDAAQSKATELYDRGATNGQIAVGSAAAGLFEYVFEKISLDKIVEKVAENSTKKGVAKYITNALMSAGIEGTEEVNTEIANYIADQAIMQDQSERQTLIDQYKADGLSEKEAKAKANEAFAQKLYQSFMGGVVGGAAGGTGMLLSASNEAVQNIKEKHEYNQYSRQAGQGIVSNANVDALIEKARQTGDEALVAQADALEKLYQSDNVSEKKLKKEAGKLYASMQESTIKNVDEATAKRAEIKRAFAEQLRGNEAIADVEKASEALTKDYFSDKLTRSEKAIVATGAAQEAKAAIKENEDILTEQAQKSQQRAYEDYIGTHALTQAQEKPKESAIDTSDYHQSADGATYFDGDFVKVKDIASVGADSVTVNLDNGKTADVKKMDLSSEDDAVIYQSIVDIQKSLGQPISRELANEIYHGYDSDVYQNATDYILGVRDAIEKGYSNETLMKSDDPAAVLAPAARDVFYRAGRNIALGNTAQRQRNITAQPSATGKGSVTFEGGDIKKVLPRLNGRRRVAVDLMTGLAEAKGLDIVFFESKKDGKGRWNSKYANAQTGDTGTQSPNGFYKNGKIYIDINSGTNGQGLILFTASHELVHMIREYSPEMYQELADFLVEKYNQKGISVRTLVLREMAKSTNLNYDEALEEVIANSCESFLRDVHLSDKAAELYRSKPTLANKIRDYLHDLLSRLKKWYAGLTPQSVEGRTVAAMRDEIQRAYDLFIQGINQASENRLNATPQNLRNMEKPADVGGAKLQSRNFTRQDVLDDFSLEERKLSDYIYVQRKVNEKLESENFFDKNDGNHIYRTDKNADSGIIVETNKGSIKETFNVQNYSRHSKELKIEKLATIRLIPEVIRKGRVIAQDVTESHSGNKDVKFIYIESKVDLNGTEKYIKLAIKQSAQKNKFWVHYVQTNSTENIPGRAKSSAPVAQILGADNNVSQSADKVKRQSRSDADYLSAVERGDMETAQRMVDEAAEMAFPNTKVRDSGDLKRVYHGRVSEFNVFERKYGNAEGNFGKGFYFTDDLNDVESNYANEEGPDLENKIARLAERLENEEVFEDYEEAEEEARRRLITSEPNTVEAFLNMTNPVYISTERKGTYLDLDYGYDEETDEYDDEASGLLYDFVEALGENISDFVDYDTVETIKAQILESAYYEGMYAYDLTEAIRNMEATIDIYDDEGNSYISEAIRQAFEDIGFDGIIDDAVSHKFKNMRLREDTTHYIVFNSEQIKIADPVTYDDNGDVIPLSERFNTEKKDIRYQRRDSRYDFSLAKDLDTLDDKALKVYNKRGWAYSLFSDEDMVLLHEKFDEYSQLKTRNSDNVLPDGSMVTDINNKMLLIGGTRNSPVIHAVLLINASAEEYAEMIKDDIYDDTKEFGIHARQCTNYLSNCENWYGNGTVKFYGSEDYYHIKGREQERAKTPDGFEDFGYIKDYEIGRRFREEAEQTGNVKLQSRDEDFDLDFLFDDDDSIENTFAKEYATHHEDIGEVLRNISDIDIAPKKVAAIVNRVLRDNLGSVNAKARELLSTELQIALDRVSRENPETIVNEMIDAVRTAVSDVDVTDDRAAANYSDLLSAFKGRKFYLTDEQISQLAEHDMTLNDFRKKMFGYGITIVSRENAKRSIDGGYADATELSLEGLYDMLESPEEFLPFRREQWDEYGYDAPYILTETLDNLRDMRTRPLDEAYSGEYVDDMAVALTAKITGAIVESKYNSKQNPYVTKLVDDLKQKRTEAVKKQKEKNRQKLAELRQKERARAEKREQEIRQNYREQRAKGYENRKRTEYRGKIRKLMKSFQSRLIKPHDGSYVPRELISQTVGVLNAINMDTGRSTKLSEKIAALRTEYDKLAKDSEAKAVYDSVISDMLSNLYDALGNTAIMDMSLEQLKLTYDTLRTLDHYIRESVRMTDTNEKRSAHALGREMIAETKAVPKEHVGLLSGYIQTQLRPDVLFNRLAGFKKNSTWSQMARMLNDGQLHMTQLQMEFSKIFADVLTDTKQLRTLSDTKHLVDIGLVDDDGNKVPITRGMMLSLYMHLQNEDNVRHVMGGGLTVPGMKEYYKGDVTKAFGSGQRSVRVGALDFTEYPEGIKTVIEKQLTDYEKLWIGYAHEFFDVASREALNDTTMKLYHFKKANVDNYFPIHTDSAYRAASFESITRDMSLENSGFMKERIKASNPILLEDIVDVINDQIQKVSKYCGLTIPIKNFQKVYGTTLAGFETSLQKEINKKFSGSKSNTGATKYIDNLITDLTSGRQMSDGPFAKFFSMARGNLAAATLTLNVRVAIAQAASYPTAAAEIGWKPLMKAFAKGGKNNRMISGADRAYIEEHTPLLWLRTQGYSNTEIGDIKEIRKQKHQIEGKFKKALGWIEFFDGMTVGRLFYAAQYYVDEQYPTLKRGSEEYKQKVAEVYNNVIEKTQPNYTTMQRPDILRNPNAIVKSLTMFMTQRLQNFNIVYDAVCTYNKYRKDLKAGVNGVTAQDLREAKTKLRRAVVSQTVAAVTIVGMKLFADMLMHSMNGYRDDDDELTTESVLLALMNNFADTIFGSVLFGSDLYSLLKSAISGERYYGISLSGVDSFTDALEKIVNLRKGINLDSANKAATAICQLMGIPLNNAEKIGKAIYNWGSDFSVGSFMEAGVERTNKQNIHRAETRFSGGDTAGAQELLSAMIEQKKAEGKTDKEAKSWLRSQLTSTYKPRYVQAVEDNNTDERTAIRQFLYQSGAYGSLSDLDKALSKWLDK